MISDPYVWREPLSKRLAIQTTYNDQTGFVVTGHATMHWPDEVDRVIAILEALKTLFDEKAA